MIKASTKKYEEIQEIINLMKINQLIALDLWVWQEQCY